MGGHIDDDQASMDTLFEVKEEVVKIKKVIDQKGSYLAMTGDMLIDYFKQQRAKEQFLESICKDTLYLASLKANTEDLLSAVASPGSAGIFAEEPVAFDAPGKVDTVLAQELPSGEPVQFNEGDAIAICSHMIKYEASATESTKALKALASLAYKKPREVGVASGVVPQVLRLLALYPSNMHVMLNGAKVIGNIAYNKQTAVEQLSSSEVIHVLIQAVHKAGPGEVRHKSSVAIANVVKADATQWCYFSSRHLFTLAHGETVEKSRGAVVVELVKEMIQNEIESSRFFVERFVEAAQICEQSIDGADHWLSMASMFGKDRHCFAVSQASTIIAAVHSLMLSHGAQAQIQVAGMGAFTDLIGTDVEVLRAFAKVKGIQAIVATMKAHPTDATVQKRGIKCLSGATQWTREVREEAGFGIAHAIELTKVSMADHRDDIALQVVAVESLHRYMTCTDFDHREVETALTSNRGIEVLQESLTILAATPEIQPAEGMHNSLGYIRRALSQYLATISATKAPLTTSVSEIKSDVSGLTQHVSEDVGVVKTRVNQLEDGMKMKATVL